LISVKNNSKTRYYSILNSSFKPTWYGIEIKKQAFTTTRYLFESTHFPIKGLGFFGITVPLGQGLFINQRYLMFENKMQMQLSQAERKLQV
jgi:hypothetical protein